MGRPARLVFAVGNASRGDDALGPALAAALCAEGWFDGGAAELIEAYQLQPEDALELTGREAVLFVDAARAGAMPGMRQGTVLVRVHAAPATGTFSHALSPAALLALHGRISGGAEAPPAWLLALQGCSFELGATLSPQAERHLCAGLVLARRWLA